LAERFFEAYYHPVSEQLTLFADTAYVLQELKKKDITVGLVSNTIFPEEYHLRELKRYNLIQYFDFTVFSSTFGFRKPHQSIFEHAVKLAALPAENLVYIGDRYVEDYTGPIGAGLGAVLKFREGREYPDPMPEEVIVVKSLSEMLPIILNEFDDRFSN
jgi:putative hydrolase of the HAD superfamily